MALRKLVYELVAVLFAIPSLSGIAAAQNWPQQKPITMIMPYGAGGGADIIARATAEELGKALGQTVIVEPRPGANGAIGTALAAKAPADGYTIVLGSTSTFASNPSLMKELPYDQLKDLVGLGTLIRSPWMLAVTTNGPYKSVQDIVSAAKAAPGKLTYGFWVSSVLVTAEMFAQTAGIELRKVPYKGSVEAVADLMANRISLLFIDINGIRSFVDSGAARFLAATTEKRVSLLPDVPTLTESGVPLVFDTVSAFFAPTGTPEQILDRYNAELVKIVTTVPAVRNRFISMGLEPTAMTRNELDTLVRTELPRWEVMVKKAGLQKE